MVYNYNMRSLLIPLVVKCCYYSFICLYFHIICFGLHFQHTKQRKVWGSNVRQNISRMNLCLRYRSISWKHEVVCWIFPLDNTVILPFRPKRRSVARWRVRKNITALQLFICSTQKFPSSRVTGDKHCSSTCIVLIIL